MSSLLLLSKSANKKKIINLRTQETQISSYIVVCMTVFHTSWNAMYYAQFKIYQFGSSFNFQNVRKICIWILALIHCCRSGTEPESKYNLQLLARSFFPLCLVYGVIN